LRKLRKPCKSLSFAARRIEPWFWCIRGKRFQKKGRFHLRSRLEYFTKTRRWLQWILPGFLLYAGARGQWVNYAEPGVPRLKDGKVNLFAPAPRTSGRPDLTGVWMHEPTPSNELKRIFKGSFFEAEFESLPPGMDLELQNKYGFDLLIDFDVLSGLKPVEPPSALMKPEGVAVQKRLLAEQIGKPVVNTCGAELVGWPQAGLLSEPIKIIQAPKETVILYEVGNLHRQVFADGRRFPSTFDLPGYLGYSVGHWEGDTFVVETRGFKEGTLLDISLHPRSEAMHVTERFHRRDFGHLDVQMTFEDPKLYTQAFSVRIPHELVPDNDVFEMFCENEKDSPHLRP
jgi:hypothetical protein